MRKPIVAGKFYPERRAELEREVKKLLSKKKQEVKLAIVPHAGYDFSGKLMGEVLGMMKEKKTFIILGVNHSGFGEKLAFSSEDFSTPLGVVKNNKILGKKIIGKLNGVVDAGINDLSHSQEHSIEVLLPFLQLSQRKFDIVPILLRNLEYEGCKEVAKILSKFVDNDVAIIVSSDMTHFGPEYGFMPFDGNVKDTIYRIDKEIIDEILKLEPGDVYAAARRSTVCGIYGVTIATEIARLKKFRAEKVDYYTSGDVVGYGGGVAVGYAGILFS